MGQPNDTDHPLEIRPLMDTTAERAERRQPRNAPEAAAFAALRAGVEPTPAPPPAHAGSSRSPQTGRCHEGHSPRAQASHAQSTKVCAGQVGTDVGTPPAQTSGRWSSTEWRRRPDHAGACASPATELMARRAAIGSQATPHVRRTVPTDHSWRRAPMGNMRSTSAPASKAGTGRSSAPSSN